jgi:hypothetical protein
MLEARPVQPDQDPGDLSYVWYVGSTPVGVGREVEWLPEGMGASEVRLVVRSTEGWELIVSTNVTIKRTEAPKNPQLQSMIAVLVMVVVLAVAGMRFLLGNRRRAGRRPGT